MARFRWIPFVGATLAVVAACAGGGDKSPPSSSAGAPPAAGSDLTPFQLENGIGPITEAIVLGPLDAHEAEEGKAIFETKCSACHKLGERYVGPALGGILDKISPTFAMNMILNPQEMYTRHPDVKKLMGEYMTQMPNQGLTQEEAREVVEYLRTTSAPSPAQ